jgi:ABC-2 type transport system ATP-binding protein
MEDDIAIKIEHVSKSFKLPHEKQSSIKGALISRLKVGKNTFEKQEVLKDISFEIKKGEFFGIVGRNGSGKSTLLKMLAGIYPPNQGGIQVNGKLTPFIELGVGFNPELTGRENVYLNGALLGFNRQEMLKMYDDIVSFAELEKFMDQKLKNYSSGMQVRLAFSIAIRAESDILLIDEVLAVGDAAFQTKCFDYFSDLKKRGATVVFVSHDRTALERFCDRGVLIDGGKLVKYGTIREVFSDYSDVVLRELEHYSEKNEDAVKGDTSIKAADQVIIIKNVLLKNKDQKVQKSFKYGQEVTIEFNVKIKQSVKNPIFGVTVWQKFVEKPVFATNTLVEGVAQTGVYEPGDRLRFKVRLPVNLNDGEYIVEPAVANESGTVFYDQLQDAAKFFINGSNNPYSIIAESQIIGLERV